MQKSRYNYLPIESDNNFYSWNYSFVYKLFNCSCILPNYVVSFSNLLPWRWTVSNVTESWNNLLILKIKLIPRHEYQYSPID